MGGGRLQPPGWPPAPVGLWGAGRQWRGAVPPEVGHPRQCTGMVSGDLHLLLAQPFPSQCSRTLTTQGRGAEVLALDTAHCAVCPGQAASSQKAQAEQQHSICF